MNSQLQEPPREYLQNLNPPQLAAVTHFRGPILVLAGAGSGKTRVLTRRVVHLVLEHAIRPENILAVTFTNKATEEMRERLRSLLGAPGEDLWVATFHSSALRILRRYATHLSYANSFAVYDEDDSRAVLKQILKELNIDEKKFSVGMFARAIDRAKNSLTLPSELNKNSKDSRSKMIAEVYELYQRKLLQQNAMDFGDLLMNVVLLFQQHPEILAQYQRHLHFVLVDEFQDTNKVQYQFLKMITALHRNLLVVGDDDQSIYAFRGANIENILKFERDFPDAKVVKLEQNYRSTANILEASHAVISKNLGRKDKKLWTSGEKGSPILSYVALDESDEASFVAREIKSRVAAGTPYSDIAIFYRTNAQSRALEEALMTQKIPYRIYGGLRFYDRKEIKDILAYLRLVVNENDNQAFLRSVNTPPRGIGPQTVQNVINFAEANSLGLFTAAAKLVEQEAKAKALAAYVQLINGLRATAEKMTLSGLIHEAIARSEYEVKLAAIKDQVAQSRIENLRELEALGRTMEIVGERTVDTLRTFLDRVSLSSSAELPVEETKDLHQGARPNTVSLMTLHLAKGLEFPYVFLTGLEEGLLPHYRSVEDPDGVEEERRLCYVGITRAMRVLYLTRAEQRGLFSAGGDMGAGGMFRTVSRFAKDIPGHCLQHLSTEFTASFQLAERSSLFDEEALDDDYVPRFPRASQRQGKRDVTSLVRPADQFGASPVKAKKEATEPVLNLPLAEAESLTPGVRVVHPYLGKGVIERIDGDPVAAPENLKISVRFDSGEPTKKLVYRFAKLSLEM